MRVFYLGSYSSPRQIRMTVATGTDPYIFSLRIQQDDLSGLRFQMPNYFLYMDSSPLLFEIPVMAEQVAVGLQYLYEDAASRKPHSLGLREVLSNGSLAPGDRWQTLWKDSSEYVNSSLLLLDNRHAQARFMRLQIPQTYWDPFAITIIPFSVGDVVSVPENQEFQFMPSNSSWVTFSASFHDMSEYDPLQSWMVELHGVQAESRSPDRFLPQVHERLHTDQDDDYDPNMQFLCVVVTRSRKQLPDPRVCEGGPGILYLSNDTVRSVGVSLINVTSLGKEKVDGPLVILSRVCNFDVPYTARLTYSVRYYSSAKIAKLQNASFPSPVPGQSPTTTVRPVSSPMPGQSPTTTVTPVSSPMPGQSPTTTVTPVSSPMPGQSPSKSTATRTALVTCGVFLFACCLAASSVSRSSLTHHVSPPRTVFKVFHTLCYLGFTLIYPNPLST
eukprot:TRINITY_DN1016_c0_g3_i1.p1 TRINITY_DN1016_c0_g3~~TRINITY_DN1016_c0_g3_i1.p1  ORF type:complete len:489 (+),score=-21.29 TRINITY_DN1016_c0_g3_i1:136-1467(+)